MAVPIPVWLVAAFAFLFGTVIGSFLNVVIWRLPRDQSLMKPEYSYCPHCKARLTAVDLVPLFSFLALGRRCRRCKAPIAWRYFYVELLTGLLFVALYWRFRHDAANAVAQILFAAVLIPIFYIDLDTYRIHDSLNLTALFIAVGRDVWGIAIHEPGHELLWGWLPRSVLGAIVGVLVFGTVRVLGWVWKRQEAMGLGDPLLARAMGAMLISVVPAGMHPLRLFPIWILLACLSGIVIGVPWLYLHRSPASEEGREAEEEAEEEPEYESSLGRELLDIIAALFLWDAVSYFILDRVYPERLERYTEEMEEDVPPAPTAIPFGPFLVLGYLATVFWGEGLTAWYLAFALRKPPSP
ncbi:MAG TPA: prepilin peptidase [Chthonomonadaceae bacterium]|nr:prepilin peptidase [Chthonomonadaceae bacterium]